MLSKVEISQGRNVNKDEKSQEEMSVRKKCHIIELRVLHLLYNGYLIYSFVDIQSYKKEFQSRY